jgi:hypothetical protein
MSVKPITVNINQNNMSSAIKSNTAGNANYANNVSFQGGVSKVVVGLMDFIAAGGFAASFIIQDGLGFVAPRVGKGLLRGGKKRKDENGNDILDKNGKPKRELNWAYARKEGIREVVTGPSAFLIPLGLLSVVKKYCGTGNNVKLNYLDSFGTSFAKVATGNPQKLLDGTLEKSKFYETVFNDTIEQSINAQLPESERMSKAEVKQLSQQYTQKQLQIENILADKSISKKERKAKVAELGSVEADFMKLRKSKIGGAVDEMAIRFSSTNGIKNGSIGELLKGMKDYFGDAVNSTRKVLKEGMSLEQIEKLVKSFTNKRMGSRVLTNLGIFGAVAAFYTQIPKLYNMGTHGKDPSQAEDEDENVSSVVDANKNSQTQEAKNSKEVPFTGLGTVLERTGEKVFNGSKAKKVSDIFELNGPVIAGTAMTTLLYGFCIPPRLQHAQSKYDYGEIVFRDLTSFTTLLFGAKALARLCSDGFTKITGLALNKKDMAGLNPFKKVLSYFSQNDKHHAVLSSSQLNSKYMNLEDYKGGVNGFVEFIEQSGGNIKKALGQDKEVKAVVDKILKDFNGKSFKDATTEEIKSALKTANEGKTKLIKDFYNLFKKENGLLNKAKTCNSSFGFLSTILLIPGLIIWIANTCEKRTAKQKEKDKEAEQVKKLVAPSKATFAGIASSAPTMAGFLGKK